MNPASPRTAREATAAPPAGSRAALTDGLGPRLWARNFTLFFTARGVAKLGDGMLPIALSAGLIDQGMGAGAIGLGMATFTACFAGFVIFGGVFSDRFNTRHLMIGADLARVAAQLVASVLFLSGQVTLWQICLIGAVNGIAAGLFQPGVASTVPRVARDVQAANGAIRTVESLAMLAGPALAGVLVAVISVGGVFLVHAGTYLVGALLLMLLRLPPLSREGARTGPRAGYWADLAEGWREFASRSWMWGVILLWMVLMITVAGPLVPLVAEEIIPTRGAESFGLVSATLGAGTAVGGLLAMRVRPRYPLRAGALALFGNGAFPAAVGAQLPVPLIAAATVVSGAAMGFWGVMWATSVQTQVPVRVLSRIHAYEVAGSLAMMPVGQALAGPASVYLGGRNVLLAGGVMALVVSGALLLSPPIRNLHRVGGPRP